jgi:hypothetical protein
MKTFDDLQPQVPRQSDLTNPAVSHPCSPVLVLSCHGGAGTTTLADQLGSTAHEGDRADALSRQDLLGQAVIVVARGTASGARQAVDAAAALLQAGAIPVVAVVSDGPWPEPLAARARLRALSGHVRVVRVPYIARWRFEDIPSTVPDRYLRAVTKLRAAYCRCTDRPADVQRTA